MQSNIKVRNNVDNDDKRFCHIFIKDCMGEDYTGFFQTAGYTEKKLLLRVIQNSIAFLIQQ